MLRSYSLVASLERAWIARSGGAAVNSLLLTLVRAGSTRHAAARWTVADVRRDCDAMLRSYSLVASLERARNARSGGAAVNTLLSPLARAGSIGLLQRVGQPSTGVAAASVREVRRTQRIRNLV
jgi:hypothetical protein